MDTEETIQALGRLRLAIERAAGRKMLTPRDFEFLRERVYARTRVFLSVSTLKRLWGYAPGGEPRVSTLGTLAQFLGYRSWGDFLMSDNGEEVSGYVIGDYLHVDEQLEPGQTVKIFWKPDRECTVRYLGNSTFRVEASLNTRLVPPDTFQCRLMISGEPLYIDNLRHQGNAPVGYVCGKISGVRFVID